MSGKYQIIYADPAWAYKFPGTRGESTPDDYPTMKTSEICALPVASIAAPDSALFMWAIWPKLNDALKVIAAWGFEYKTVGFVWVKTNKSAPVQQYSFLPVDSFADFFGMGMWTRSNTEFCLIGTRGNPRRVSNDVRQVIYSPLMEHSRKPAETRDRIVRLMGDLPRIELFAREAAEGWDVWGNEVESTVELNTEAA